MLLVEEVAFPSHLKDILVVVVVLVVEIQVMLILEVVVVVMDLDHLRIQIFLGDLGVLE
jgi:hypothetical protein